MTQWADEPLSRFQVADWSGDVFDGGSGTLFGLSASGPGTQIVMEATVVHRRPYGSGIDVQSHRADDYEEQKASLPMNMLLRTEHDRLASLPSRRQDAEMRRLRQAAADGTIPWSTAVIAVDGNDIAFDVLAHKGQWVAIGVARDVFVMIDSYGVDLADVRLVTVPDAASAS
jgi:hypothetical protein